MPQEWVMYISVVAIGVLTIAGVTLTFNSINTTTLENTIEVGLNEVAFSVAQEIKNVLELGLQQDLTGRVIINRSLILPLDLSSHDYQITFRILPGANHWFIEASDLTDSNIQEVVFETTIPWRNVTLVSPSGLGLPVITSTLDQHYVAFQSLEGTEAFRIIIL
ncbi:MAG: hypothetical protein ACTSXO_06310 [Candidatus Heimdallarchaeota archaeon]|nr:hypothetical protein [Candidatus Heimdallarchaeota archaeon]RLI70197.1 MAG: hypothetical protein DRP02_08570 [Candidatus Gerdarchaeota archaeon]